ncbi:FliI/YscN family ATPase [Pseudoduganella ginsengisoli]|uniref:FliI/YscN family ATPase n=2 Tax=Pseudoduganella ginsengisoli TaxID=1462440 RepID=A0A6L6QA66_9BURK|nr:FliI/YscN family ATPase [Pseudoduganella ginsengisoli]MTW06359.1 FliI/YscN family ATPase [Pseudoduganella ginsengisoli]
MQRYLDAVRAAELVRKVGHVRQLAGLGIESSGPDVLVGEICDIVPRRGADAAGHAKPLRAEVVGLRDGRVMLMPYGELHGVGVGSRVIATGQMPRIAVGPQLLGRVIDAFGTPLDDGPAIAADGWRPLKAAPLNPLTRPRVDTVLETGIRCIDGMLTLGQGQRVGIFAGSGVGKSTLLGMIARHALSEVNVIALIGERGREVREFIDKQLGEDGLRRSVVVVATSDQPALARARAAYAATAIAEYFRGEGRQVMLMMDSVTRFAMARREIGLAVGEPPTARGYTPSVFAELPELCERCGTAAGGGAITALYTVLVDGDDFNEPVSDMLRATLDGHVVLARRLAQQGHYPAIDVLHSVSRLFGDLVTPEDQALVHDALECLAVYERNRQLIDMGAYKSGSSADIDRAIALWPALSRFLRQREGGVPRADALALLRAAMQGEAQP